MRKEIQFDPELLENIKSIYGDSDLDGKTLKRLHETWRKDPNSIKRQAMQARISSSPGYFDAAEINPVTIQTPTIQAVEIQPMEIPEIATDDLRGIDSFREAFRIARQRGLKQFKWNKGVYGTKLASQPEKVEDPQPNSQINIENPQNKQAISKQKPSRPKINSVQATTNRHTMGNTVQGDFGINRGLRRAGQAVGKGFMNFLSWLNEQAANDPYSKSKTVHPLSYYQQGGTMNNQEELQKAFMAYLIQDAQAQGIQLQSEQDLQAYAEQLGEDGIKAKYQEFIQKMQGGVMAKLGAKLQYYKKLKGICPEGYEMTYFKVGGKICKSCQKKQMEKGGKAQKKLNAVQKFKQERKTINPNDTIHTKKGIKDLNGRTKYPRFNPKEATRDEKIRASEKDYFNTKKSGYDPNKP